MRLTVVWLRPDLWAMDRVLQWVASLGVVSNVNAITRSTSASSIIRGRPLRGWSNRPSSPCSSRGDRARLCGPDMSVVRQAAVASRAVGWVSNGRRRFGVNLVSLIVTLREEGRLPVRSIQWYLQTVHQLELSVG